MLQDYEIAYTFGVYPLQQYLIAFPGGRYQALPSPGTAGPLPPAGNAGSISIPGKPSPRGMRCTGPG